MASLLHVAVGLAGARALAGRPALGPALLGVGLSLLPDADVIAFAFGVPYADPLGHRGASHSLAFAVGMGVLVGAVAAARRSGGLRWGLGATALVASHPLLDALTDGGLGVALFWPWDGARHFAPWRPIPVAPIGPGMLSARGAAVLLAELLPSLPLLLAGLWPGRTAAAPRA